MNKECFICFESILHGISFSCKHEICIYCFMKLDQNLCPYCRFPIFNTTMVHYSKHIPPFLNKICKGDDIFKYVLLQIYHTNDNMFCIHTLIRDIQTWNIKNHIKKIYIREIKVLYKYIHPENNQILFLLINLSLIASFLRNEEYTISSYPYKRTIMLYPLFVISNILTMIFTIFYLNKCRKRNKYDFSKRNKIKIENIME